jgi:hypothetical protein
MGIDIDNKIITLTTDFGIKDPFVSTMKGVILDICPGAILVDITHQIEPYNILEAALTLKASYLYFPPGTIHLVVIDPGVGSSRRPILVETAKYYFVAPDNGVLSFVYQDKELKGVREITSSQYFRKEVSQTFHGRDIFAPVAAWLACGEKAHLFGPPLLNYTTLSLPQPRLVDNYQLKGEIIYMDRFGNLMSNIDQSLFQSLQDIHQEKVCKISLGTTITIRGINQYYAEAYPGEPGAIFNSWGYLEIYINQGNAQQQLGLGKGAKIDIIFS